MNIYVATKFEDGHFAKKVMAQLKEQGHHITHDWTNENSDGLKGVELEEYLMRCAEADLKGVQDCDLLLLLNHPHGKGMFTELGFAIALNKQVLVVRPKAGHNIFFHMKKTKMVETIEEALKLTSNWTTLD